MKKVIVLLVVSSMLLSAWTFQKPGKLTQVDWLIGTWENKTKRGSIYERWEQAGANEFVAKSFKIESGDTILFETIRLVEEGKDLFYIPTVSDQNSEQPVKFRAVLFSAKEMKFENKSHDFPQFIEYKLIRKDSLVAQISGMRDGQMRGSRFPMKRVY